MLQRAAGNAYSWWWASHIRTKQSKWLEQNLQDFEDKVQDTLKLIEEEGDSFAKRAEMYYKNRPELIVFVQEAFRSYRALAERYDHLSTELQKANTTIASVFPEQVQFAMEEEDEYNSLKNGKKLPRVSKLNVPQAPAGPVKELRNMFSNATKKFQPKPSTKKVTRTTSSSVKALKSGLSKPDALGRIDKLQKEILVLQTEKEFLKSSYDHGVKKYRSIDKQIEEMHVEVSNLQDEFSDGMFIKDEEARSLMASTALKSCQEALANLQEKHEKTAQEATAERERIRTAREKLESLKDEFGANGMKARSESKPSVEGREELKSKQHEKELETLRGEIKEHFEDGEGSCLTVSEMAEKVDELVEKVIGLETSFAGQTALVHRLRSETDELQAQIKTLEDDEANLVSGSNNLISKLKEMEEKLKRLQEIDQNIEDQNKNMHTHFTQVQCNLDHLSERLDNVKSDDEELEEKKPKKSKKESKAERKARKSSENEENSKQDKESTESVKSQEKSEGEAASLNISNDKELEITGSAQADKQPAKSQGPKQQEAASRNISDGKKIEFTGSSQTGKEPGKSQGPKQQEASSLNISDAKELEITGSSQRDKEPGKSQGPKQQEASSLNISDAKELQIAGSSQTGKEPGKSQGPKQQEAASRNRSNDKELEITGSSQTDKEPAKSLEPKQQESASLNISDAYKELEITGSSQTGKEPAKSQGPKQQEAASLNITDDKKPEISQTDKEPANSQEPKQQEAAELNSSSAKEMKNSKSDKEVKVTGSLEKQEGPTGEVKLKELSNIRVEAHIPGEGLEKAKDVIAEAEEGRKGGQGLSTSVINQRENGGLPKRTLNRYPPEKDLATLPEKALDSPQENSLASFLGIEPQEQEAERDVDDEPNWRVLFLQGMENREKTLLAEYTTVLRNFKELKKQHMEVEKKSQDGLFETTLHLRKLKAANAMKDQEIKSLRQKLKHLQIMFDSGEMKAELLQSPRSVGEVEVDEDEDMKYALEASSHEISEIEEKFRGDIDALLEENLEFWLRFSTSFHQLQKCETEFEDLKADVSKLKKANRSEVNVSKRNCLKSDARSIYKHLREIQTELTVWMEQSAQLKEELQSRFASLCSIQEEITQALKDSARDEDFKFTSFQAAKFQGEVLNMKQENNKVADELQAGLDHVTSIQLQVEQCLTKLDDEFGITGNQNNMQLAHCENRNPIPLSSFLFGVKQKKQKQSILACVSPALNKKYNIIKQGVLM